MSCKRCFRSEYADFDYLLAVLDQGFVLLAVEIRQTCERKPRLGFLMSRLPKLPALQGLKNV